MKAHEKSYRLRVCRSARKRRRRKRRSNRGRAPMMAQLQNSSSSRSNRNSNPNVNGIEGGKSNTSSSSPIKRGCCLGCQFCLGVSSRKKPSSRESLVDGENGGVYNRWRTTGRYRRYQERKATDYRRESAKKEHPMNIISVRRS